MRASPIRHDVFPDEGRGWRLGEVMDEPVTPTPAVPGWGRRKNGKSPGKRTGALVSSMSRAETRR